MNTENRVFNKLAQAEKVELSAQKVELGLIDDVINEEKQGNKYNTEALDGLDMAVSSFNNAKKKYEAAEKIVNKAIKLADELGDTGVSKLYQKRKSLIKSEIQNFSKRISKIKSI